MSKFPKAPEGLTFHSSALSFMAKDLEKIAQAVAPRAQECEQSDVLQVVRAWHHLRSSYEQLDAHRKQIGETLERMSREVIPTLMEEAGVKTVTLDDVGYRFTVSARLSASIPQDVKADAYDWLRENDYGDLIIETVNSSTLASFAKNLIEEEGKELPPELFKLTTMKYTSATKVKQ